MKISVCSINSTQEYKPMGVILGGNSEYDSEVIEFVKENCFTIDGIEYEISARFSKNNCNGNISITKDGEAYLSSLVTVDETFVLTIRASIEYWIHITISE